MLIKKDSYEFNEEFFKTFTKRWLKTNEVYLLLSNVQKLMKIELIKITEDFLKIEPIAGSYYFIKNQNNSLNEVLNKNNIISLRNKTQLKFDGLEVLECQYDTIKLGNDKYLRRRIYQLLIKPKNSDNFSLIHFYSEGNNDLNNLDNILENEKKSKDKFSEKKHLLIGNKIKRDFNINSYLQNENIIIDGNLK